MTSHRTFTAYRIATLSVLAGAWFFAGQAHALDAAPPAVQAALQKNACLGCHAVSNKVVGPSFNDIAQKYKGKTDYLAGKIKSGGSGVWGTMSMPPQTAPDAEIRSIATWLAGGK